jgi:7,8-dihydroneopterin aldolase/epimerase/oxygenase
MGLITLQGMRFYAYHGFYPEENILGGEYIVDVTLETAFNDAAVQDNLERTANYETVYLICKVEMKKNAKLLETVAARIIMAIKRQFSGIQNVKVTVQKLNPPLGGRVDAAIIETNENFSSSCGKCGKKMICYKDGNCWCGTPSKTLLSSPAREAIAKKYKGCLCDACLELSEKS